MTMSVLFAYHTWTIKIIMLPTGGFLLYAAFITTSRRYIKEEAQIQSNFIKQLLFLFLLLDLVVPPSFKQQGFEKIDTIDKSFKSLVIRICIINIYKIII